MSIDPHEYDMEQALDQLYEENIEEFISDRLISFYQSDRKLLIPAFNALDTAKKLNSISPTASQVFATTAIEISLKDGILKPILYGLVHNENVAELIMGFTTRFTDMDRYKGVLNKIIYEYGNIVLKEYYREGKKDSIMNEIRDIQTLRNKILHKGIITDKNNSLQAIEVTETILTTILPKVLDSFKLTIKDDGEITYKYR